MPEIKNIPATSYDLSDTNKTAVSEVFFTKYLPQSPFYNNVLVDGVVDSTETKHYEDMRVPTASTIASGSITSASTTLNIKDELYLETGSLLQLKGSIFEVTTKSTGKTVTGKFISIDEAAKGSFAATTNDKIYTINNALVEASEAKFTSILKEFPVLNFTQIMDTAFSISKSQLSVNRGTGLPDIVTSNADKKMDKLRSDFARYIWSGVPFNPENNAKARRMGGIYYYTQKYGYTASITGGTLTQDKLDEFLFNAADKTGNDITQLWINPSDLKHFKGLLTDATTPVMPDGRPLTIGNVPRLYISNLGYNVSINTDFNCMPGRFWLGSPSLIKIKALQGRAFTIEDISEKKKDSKDYRILGEYTLEFNPCSTTAYVDLKA